VAPVEAAIREIQPRLEEVRTASVQIREQTQRIERLVQDQEALRLRPVLRKEDLQQMNNAIAQSESIRRMLEEIRSTLDRHEERLLAIERRMIRVDQPTRVLPTKRPPQ
jgi:hypothetical protein